MKPRRFITPKDDEPETKQMFLRYRFCDLLNEDDIHTVLDMGAGAGLGTVYFAERDYEVTWVDHNRTARRICRYLFRDTMEKDNVKQRYCDFEVFYIDNKNVKYDMSIAMDFLQQTKNPLRTLCRLMDITSKVLVFSFPVSTEPIFTNDVHILNKKQFNQFNVTWYFQKENGGIDDNPNSGRVIRNIGIINLRKGDGMV